MNRHRKVCELSRSQRLLSYSPPPSQRRIPPSRSRSRKRRRRKRAGWSNMMSWLVLQQ